MRLPILVRNVTILMTSTMFRWIPILITCAVVLLLHCGHLRGHLQGQIVSLPPSLNLSDPKVIAAGEGLFAKSCSVGYCHGVAGKAGRGPRLRGREWDKNYLFKVTYDGIPNSSMPAWKDRLTANEIGSIVAYILTLSKLTSDSAEPASLPAASLSSPDVQPRVAAVPSPVQVRDDRIDGLKGDPEKGKTLFFDASNDFNCGVCHKVRGAGGDVGPDLSQIHHKPAREILKDIVLPSASLSPSRQLLKIALKTGQSIQGIRIEESSSHLKIYDMESLPPVLRTVAKDQIQAQEAQDRSAMPEKYGAMFTLKQLLDIIAFIKQGDSSSPVRVEELF